MPITKPAALYARVSTRDKDQNPEGQLIVLRDWAEREGYTATEYVDHGSAADLSKRPQWVQLLKDCRQRKVGVVAVLRLDRAFRSIQHLYNTLDEWERFGVQFVCVTQPIDTTSATGRLTLNILASVAQFERELTGERVKEGMTRARRDGARIGRPKRKLSAERARHALDEHGSLSKAAAALGVSESTLRRRVNTPPKR